MLRPLLIGLVVVNAALLVARLGGAERWLSGGDAREHEPERLQRQLNPGALRVQPVAAGAAAAAAAGAASAAGPAAAAASAAASAPPGGKGLSQGSVSGGRQGASTAIAQAAAPTRERACVEAGPFDAAMLAAAKRVLHEAGVPETAWQAASAPAAPRHVLLMGRYADPEHLQRKTGELRRKGVHFVELHESADIPAKHLPGLVLGRYADAHAAESALAALRNRGVVSARLVTLEPRAPGTLLRVADAGGGDLKARTATLTLPGRHAWRPCAAGQHGAATTASGVTLQGQA